MNMRKIQRAKGLAKEFIEAVNELEKRTEICRPEWTKSKEYAGYVETGAKSGLVRHWSVILSRALADMRKIRSRK